jgi:hypothetical protein
VAHVTFIIHAGVDNVVVGDGAPSFVAVVDVVSGDDAAGRDVAESMGMGAFVVYVVAASTVCAEGWGRWEGIGGVPVIPIPRVFLLVFASKVVKGDGVSHGEQFGSVGQRGRDGFPLAEIRVDVRPYFGVDESVANSHRSGTPVSKLVLQIPLGLQEILIV